MPQEVGGGVREWESRSPGDQSTAPLVAVWTLCLTVTKSSAALGIYSSTPHIKGILKS